MEKRAEKILIIGALGQLGSELTLALADRYGSQAVTASDIVDPAGVKLDVRYEQLDVTSKSSLGKLLFREQFTQVYMLAAVLSAKGEQHPQLCWELNMSGLLHVLELCAANKVGKVFFPSSIAVFGPGAAKVNAGQLTGSIPSTVYGMSKLSGEYWCQYYFDRYGLDVRSIRFPGLISYKALPGGGTTDYAVDIFYKAKAGEPYSCFLKRDTLLPMMYMDDAVRAVLELMDAPSEKISVRSSYNLSAMSFSPGELASEIQKRVPDFKISYAPDFRQAIAESWPASLNDRPAREDWGWKPAFSLSGLAAAMLENVNVKEKNLM